jgi:membrane protein
MDSVKQLLGHMKEAWTNMGQDMAGSMGAAIAYYTIFSIAPLLVIAIGVAGFAFGGDARETVFSSLQGLLGEQGGTAVASMVDAAANRPRAGMVATAIGVVTLLVGASSVFGQLQTALNLVWKVATKPHAGWSVLIRQRLLSFGMVAVVGFLLLVSMVVSAGLAAAGTWASEALPGGQTLWSAVNFAFSLAVITALFSALFKLLPDVKLSWRDVRVGGFVTALLFVVGKAAIGAYIGRSGVASSYGAAGSIIVVLLWVFYSSQILLYGAEFTRAWATRGGRVIAPKETAVKTLTPANAAAMAEQAIEAGEAPFPVSHEFMRRAGAPALYGAGAGLLAAAAALLYRKPTPQRRLAAGAALGAGAGLVLIGAGARRSGRKPSEDEGPSLVSRAIAAIPMKVKLAAAGGAVKSGGSEAAHELGEAVKEKVQQASEKARPVSTRKHHGRGHRRPGSRMMAGA